MYGKIKLLVNEKIKHTLNYYSKLDRHAIIKKWRQLYGKYLLIQINPYFKKKPDFRKFKNRRRLVTLSPSGSTIKKIKMNNTVTKKDSTATLVAKEICDYLITIPNKGLILYSLSKGIEQKKYYETILFLSSMILDNRQAIVGIIGEAITKKVEQLKLID